MNRFDRFVTFSAALFALSAFAMHFAMTALYVSPLNPIKAGLLLRLSAYAGDLFAQNWSLFAPLPVHENVRMLIQCRAGERESSWFDLTSAFDVGLHRFPAGPYVRLVRMPLKALRDALGADSDPEAAALLKATCKSGPKQTDCIDRNPLILRRKAEGRLELRGLASAACEDVFPGELTAVRVTATASALRPWSQRNSDHWRPTATTVAETPWMQPRIVAPMPFVVGR